LNKKRSIRLILAVAVAAVVSVPLIAQVKKAQESRDHAQLAAEQVHAADIAPATPEPAAPATKPVEVDPSKVIVTKGDVTVTAGEFNAVVATLPAQYQAAASDPSFKKQVADKVLQIKELAAEARKRNLQDKPEVKQQLEIQEDQVLSRAFLSEMQGEQSDKDARAYFEANKPSFDTLKARHILIRSAGSPVPLGAGKKELTDAEAKAKADQIEQRLSKGEDFAVIAKAESDDTTSGAQGGDLSNFPAWSMVRPFSKAALAMKKNEISQPVKTQFGYHIIQLLDDQPRTFEQAKAEIAKARMNEMMSSMEDKSKPEYDPSFFGGAPESAATQPAAAHLPANH
jgi:parvulin-like peptidyl-prolyl isomerase